MKGQTTAVDATGLDCRYGRGASSSSSSSRSSSSNDATRVETNSTSASTSNNDAFERERWIAMSLPVRYRGSFTAATISSSSQSLQAGHQRRMQLCCLKPSPALRSSNGYCRTTPAILLGAHTRTHRPRPLPSTAVAWWSSRTARILPPW